MPEDSGRDTDRERKADRERATLYDASKPVVCTIEAPHVGPHIETLERLREAVGSVDRSADGVVVRFPASADTADDVDRFVAEEARCCEFWGFDVSETKDGWVVLRWEGPPETQPFMDLLLGYLRGEVPVGSLFGAPERAEIAEPRARR